MLKWQCWDRNQPRRQGRRGLLSLAVPAAKCETTARGLASSFKDQGWVLGFFCHPGWKQILCIYHREPSFLLKKLCLCFFSLRKMEFQFLGFLIEILILSYIPLFPHLKLNLIIVADAL